MRRLQATSLGIIAAVVLNVQGVRAEGEKIIDVRVNGNRRVETAAITNALSLKTGDLLYAEKVDADVRAVYKLGQFIDVRAETEQGDGGVVLVYTVQEKPIIREIRIEGNKELSTDKVRDALGLKANSIFSQKELTLAGKRVKKLYGDEGYYLAEVTTRSEKRSDTDVRVIVSVAEGEKVLIKSIRFEGNKAFSASKVRGVMETKEKWFLSWLTGAGTYKDEVVKNDVNLIADLYFNNGYVNVKVGEPQVTLNEDKSGLIVTIGITEGDQFRTGSIGFKGDLLEKEEDLAKGLRLKSGDIFSRANLRTDVMALTDLYADKGFAFANVTPLTKVNPETKTVDLTFEFEKGDKVFFDRINVSGNTKTRDKVIRRELKVAEGETYSSTGLKQSKQRLMNLGFFEEAAISTVKGSSENKLDVNIEVKEKPTGTFSIGAGYSSLDGLIGQGSVSQGNFLGLGLRANLAASIGGKSSTFNLGLTDPYFLDTRWTLGGDLYRTERDYLDFTRRATGGDIKAGYPLSDTMRTLWVYKYEQKEIFDISPALRVVPETDSTTSSIYVSLTRDTTDYRLDPTRGMVNNLSVEFAGLGGTNRFLRYYGDTSVFFPTGFGTVLSLRGTLGYIQGLGGKDISIDERFFAGGINTLRGFEGRSVSPSIITYVPTTDPLTGLPTTNPERAFVGGDKEAILNVEYTIPLLKDAGLKGVLFFDAGNVYGENQDMFSSVLMSYGAGIRWVSPMGPLRLEYGIPLNPRDGIDKSSGRFEFSIGSFF
ncbi:MULTISPECIES: outer membrane protein assembly factor BamA [Geobacter]|uniref:Outer membrane protein assembly factor BamA n=2 Tax=Geobacter TaxID=28231 RepID=A0A0C1U1W0_9BACT|nr:MULTISPECIES: outer membrane protein assembly factor BamA [Geobacter]ANA39948.1 outer membrane protein assembly factor BamA [Geobacter anodireducens]KIE41795.1 membrane protein [Geobacter soli]MBE2887929.1 outer membrane protein assembly factor BamA [Geobacter anodireducens]HMN01465.1 outer membrane protein assembly factor BamA [Geobacter anodireducens]